VLTYRERDSATSQTHQAAALVSFETGEVHVATEGPEAADNDRVLTWIADELDGELLDRLYDDLSKPGRGGDNSVGHSSGLP
jgi:hypothetical protein